MAPILTELSRTKRAEGGSGLLSTVMGVACLVAMLGFSVNVMLGLWTRSTVDSIAYDAARDVATAPSEMSRERSASAARERAADLLGTYGNRVELRFEALDDDEVVVLRVRAPGVALLPRLIDSGPVVGAIDRRIVVRREGP